MEPWDPLDAFESSSMALGIEEESVLVSMLPYGPWSRVPTDKGHGGELARAWLGCSSYGLVFSMPFRCCFGLERRFRV
nr:MAG TPA: hypothetical protein [Caudoviricetes sp.]